MHFCEKCGNMYYLKILNDSDDQLLYYCRKCGNNSSNPVNNTNAELCVSKTHIKKTMKTYRNIINKYTKLDPTLPRLKNMKCTNIECPTGQVSSNGSESKNTDKKLSDEIIYLRYDNDNMKYIYLCAHCDHTWINK